MSISLYVLKRSRIRSTLPAQCDDSFPAPKVGGLPTRSWCCGAADTLRVAIFKERI